MPTEPRLHLTVTLPQARALVEALEIYMRLGLGQVHIIAEMVSDGAIPVKADSRELPAGAARPTGGSRILHGRSAMDVVHGVTALCNEIRRELGFQPGESYGVGNRAVSDKAHRAFEMEKVIQKALALHDNPNPTFRGCHYDGLAVRYTEDPVPVCVIERSLRH